MKRIFYIIVLGLVLCIADVHGTDISKAKAKLDSMMVRDTLDWAPAEEASRKGDYYKASTLYHYLNKKAVKIYTKMNGEPMEKLRSDFTVDEAKLKSYEAQNKLLFFVWVAGLLVIVVAAISLIVIYVENKKLVKSRRIMNEAKEEAEKSTRNKSLFLSNMSHEIKTPLNALSGFADILTMDGIDDATRQQCNEVIHLNSELLMKLLHDVIDISCLDINNMSFTIKKCEVVSLCRNVTRTIVSIKQTSADIVFETDIQSLEIDTDVDRLQQMIINLLVNATKFTPSGTITLRLDKDDRGWAQFSVTDTGCGISLENQKKIFNRFEKLNEKAQGTGLGLSICQLIINRLGGDIHIDADYHDGARFVFVHPITQEEAQS